MMTGIDGRVHLARGAHAVNEGPSQQIVSQQIVGNESPPAWLLQSMRMLRERSSGSRSSNTCR